MGFSKQEYWSGLPFPSPGDLPDPGMEPRSPSFQAESLPSEPPGKTNVVLCCAVLCLVTQSCLTLCDPVDCSLPDSSVHWDSSVKNAGVGCYASLQGIFPTQGSNPALPHCSRILHLLSHQGSPSVVLGTHKLPPSQPCH